jgi:hypothetical protein
MKRNRKRMPDRAIITSGQKSTKVKAGDEVRPRDVVWSLNMNGVEDIEFEDKLAMVFEELSLKEKGILWEHYIQWLCNIMSNISDYCPSLVDTEDFQREVKNNSAVLTHKIDGFKQRQEMAFRDFEERKKLILKTAEMALAGMNK